MKIGYGKAHGKIILIGEHSVVYGKRAISIPFNKTSCNVEVWENADMEIETSLYNGNILDAPSNMESIISLIKEMKEKLDIPNLYIKIESNIPIGSGMGSSAAIAGAIIEAVYNFLGKELSAKERFRWVQYSEKIAHGNPSGIDALTTSHNNAWLFQREVEPVKFDSKLDAFLVVGQSGELGNTKEAVSLVKRKVEKLNLLRIIDILGETTELCYRMYLEGDIKTVGLNLTTAHIMLKTLGVSTKRLDEMVRNALNLGSLGAKLTGGGLGGCIIALASTEEIARKIKNNWEELTDLQAWILNLKEE